MAFVKVMKNREGNKYVSIVEGYRDGDKVKHRTIKSLGKLELLEADNPNFLEELKQEVKAGKYNLSVDSMVVNFDLNKGIGNPLKNYGWKVLEGIYDELAVSKALDEFKKGRKSHIKFDEILKLLVFQRILNPESKMKTVENQTLIFDAPEVVLHDVYRSLDVFNDLSEEIQLNVHRQITNSIGRSAALVFYDVTNYYFETDLDDESAEIDGKEVPGLRRRGPSKERRPKPIVQMGLFMDTNGIPIAYKLFPGNCVDVKTYLPATRQVKAQFGIDRIVVVADKGMNSKGNISATLNENDGYLFSQKFRGKQGAPKDIQIFILNNDDWQMNESETFAMKSFIRQRTIDGTLVTEKVLATWNQKYDFREKIRREKSVEYAEKLTASERFRMTMKKGGKRYLNVEQLDPKTGEITEADFHITIDEEQIEYDAQFDGINVLITSEVDMSDQEMLRNYNALSKIENCFRVMKSDFDARPVFVWNHGRINAHFLICFLSLIVMRVLEHQTAYKYSPAILKEALGSAQCKELDKGYWEVFGNDNFLDINRTLELDWNKQYVPIEKLRKYGKSLRIQQDIS